MNKILKSEFFDRPTLIVAEELIGKFLVRRLGDERMALMITETEAYDGFADLASHARHGQTARTAPMFAKAGTIYVYFVYGMHWMLNIVCGKEGYPAAVLVRGAGEVVGPARLAKALRIDKSLNGKRLGRASGLWVEDGGTLSTSKSVVSTPRVGIGYAGSYVDKPWRFLVKDDATD